MLISYLRTAVSNAAGERPAKPDRSTGGLGFAPAASCRCGPRLHDEGTRRNKDLLATLIAERGGIADKSQIGLALRDATSLDLDTSLQPVTGAYGTWQMTYHLSPWRRLV